MNKAKLVLAAVAVMAVAGGVYAAKAKRGSQIFCTNPSGVLTRLPDYTISNVGTTSFCTTAANGTPAVKTITVNF